MFLRPVTAGTGINGLRPSLTYHELNSSYRSNQRFDMIMRRKSQFVWVIDQVWGQDGWILAKFFFCVFMDRDEVEVHKLAKKERGQYPAILTEQTWSIKDLLYGF